MTVTDEEKQPLVAKEATSEPAPTKVAVPVEGTPAVAEERDWDGHLLQVCGECDPLGVSTFAYVKYCFPVAWGHNMKRAFNAGFWKHAIIFTLLFSVWAWVYFGYAVHAGNVCRPDAPHMHHHHHDEKPWPRPPWDGPEPGHPVKPLNPIFMTEPKAQAQPLTVEFGPEPVVSSGVSQDVQQKAEDAKDWAQETTASAAEKAQKLAENAKQEAAAYWGKIQQQASAALGNAGEEQPLDDQINDQIQQAKEQVSAAMTQLNAQFGRKMLHKHDDEEEDRHHHEEKEAKKAAKKAEKEAKKAAKKAKKEAKHAAEEALDFEPFPTEFDWEMDPELDGPPKPSPECLAAQRSMLAMWGILTISVLLGTIYAARMRTAMRERFGIPGSRMRDFFAWFCCSPCALCQETRTLAANNVHGGVWFGPTVLSAPQPHPMAAPVVQSATKPEGHITKG